MIGRASRLRFKQLVQTLLIVVNGSRVVPFFEQLVTLGLVKERQTGETFFRGRNNALQQETEMLNHAFGCRSLEEVCVVFERAEDPVAGTSQVKHEIKFRRPALALQHLQLKL